jgi:hypothetical protein
MNKRVGLRVAFFWLSAIGALADARAVPTLHFDSFVETKVVGTTLAADTTWLLDGRLRDSTANSITNRLFFRPGSTSLALSAGWLTAPSLNRTIGVNIDLLDFNNNLIATDSFLGLDGALARSQLLATNLVAGAQYQLVFTGTAAEAGRYAVALASGQVFAPLPDVPVVSPAASALLFDTHSGTKELGRTFINGDQLFIDGAMPDDTLSGITNEFKFTSTAGTLSGGIEWIVGDLDDVQRTIGVNVDIFDAFNNLVATDTFQGVFGGQAFSQILPVGLLPGTYTLRFTGIANLAGRYRVHLSTDTTAPGFEPIVDPAPAGVPEPGSLALACVALALLLACAGVRSASAAD